MTTPTLLDQLADAVAAYRVGPTDAAIAQWQAGITTARADGADWLLTEFDLGDDLGFLLMDLEARLDRAAANRVLNRYLARTGNWGLVRGLKPILSNRAMVRADVEQRSGHPDRAAADRAAADHASARARAHASLAPGPAIVIGIGGLPGTGKSTLARAIAPTLGPAPGAVIVRSDEIRKRQHGAAPEQKLPSAAYRKAASRAVIAELAAAVRSLADAGQAVIADATFMAPADRAMLAAAAGSHRFLGIWLHAPLALLKARIAARVNDASDADVAVLRRAAQSRPEAGTWLAVDATDGASACSAVVAALRDADVLDTGR